MQYLRLFRAFDLLLITLAQYFIRFFVIKPFYELSNTPLQISEPLFVLLILASIFVAMGGYLINDYYDLKINGWATEGNYVGKIISAPAANNLSLIFSAVGSVLGLAVAFKTGFLNVGMLFLVFATVLYFYALRYKRSTFWGDFCIAFLASAGVAVVWLFEFFALRKNPHAFGDLFLTFKNINSTILALSGLVFLLVFIRQMLKDIIGSEFEPKSLNGKMISTVLGVKKTCTVIAVITTILIVVIAVAEVVFYNSHNRYFVYTVAILLEMPLLMFVFKLFKANSKEDFQILATLLKIILIIVILLTVGIRYSILQ